MSKKPSATVIINAVGALAALTVVGWIAASLLSRDEPDICEGRYPVSTRLSLNSASGQPVSLSELQARFGSQNWGVLENVRVLPPDDAGADPNLEVTIEKDTGAGYKENTERGGVGFAWRPSDMIGSSPKAACLSYRVFLPEGMKFAEGGTLPGLMIGSDFDPRGEAVVGSGAVARPGWNKDGRLFVAFQYAAADGWKNPVTLGAKAHWPLGRWVKVEQELILNDPGKKNGILRVWLDGELVGENKTATFRGDDSVALAGVMADVHYGSVTMNGKAPDTTEILMSPFVVRWQ